MDFTKLFFGFANPRNYRKPEPSDLSFQNAPRNPFGEELHSGGDNQPQAESPSNSEGTSPGNLKFCITCKHYRANIYDPQTNRYGNNNIHSSIQPEHGCVERNSFNIITGELIVADCRLRRANNLHNIDDCGYEGKKWERRSVVEKV